MGKHKQNDVPIPQRMFIWATLKLFVGGVYLETFFALLFLAVWLTTAPL
jgi:hypothetical protein